MIRSLSFWRDLIDFLRGYPATVREQRDPLGACQREVEAARQSRDTRRLHWALENLYRARHDAIRREVQRRQTIERLAR